MLKKIGVLGTGTMGAGIIQVLALNDFDVLLTARRQTSVDNGITQVEKNLDRMVAKGKLTELEKKAAMEHIHGSTDIHIVKDADLIIEATTEDMEAKKALFRQLDEICRPGVILATNTSSLSITDIAEVTKRPDKVIGMHFFNPVPAMKLVEIILGMKTSHETKIVILELSRKLDKTPVEVAESPGFVVNRILIPSINEGIGILESHVASAEDIDKAMMLGANHPMGPLALGDLIGLDVCLAIMNVLHYETGDQKYRPRPLLRKRVRAGKLGRQTGEGFYKYD